MNLRVGFVAIAVLARSAIAAEPEPAHDYVLHCAGCHKLDGSGSARVPALDEVGRLAEHREGRDYLLAVPGVAQAPLSDARLANLINWVLDHFGDRPLATRFSAAEVGAARATPLLDPKRARAELR